jgi:hypothetical protein
MLKVPSHLELDIDSNCLGKATREEANLLLRARYPACASLVRNVS